MKNKKELKEIKLLTETICKSCKNYEDTITALSPYLTNISDENSPNIEEINKKYNILEIIKSKSKTGLIFSYENETKLVIDYYNYTKAPHGVVIILSLLKKWKNEYIQKDIDIFIKEN